MDKPRIGVGLLLIKDGKLLMGRRRGSHGHGEYCGTGGHLEPGETIEECIYRELAEEAGPDIKIKNLRFLGVINLKSYAPKHYIDISMVADWKSGEPKVMEPKKRENWRWIDIDNLPTPLFAVMPYYIEAYKTGKTFFEA